MLQAVEQFSGFVRLTAQKKWSIHMYGHGKRAHVILLHVVEQLQVFRTFHIQKTGAAPDHEHLADFFFER